MPATSKRTLVILLVLRVVAAPVALRPATPSLQQTVVIRMRCWPPQQLQRFSARSKLLQLCLGKNRLIPGDEHPVLRSGLSPAALRSYLAVTIANARHGQAGYCADVSLRC